MEIRRWFAVNEGIDGCGFAALPIDTAILGHAQRIYPTLLWGGGSAVLVDSAYPKKEDELLESVKRALGTLDALAALAITHQDIDHIGGGEGILLRLDHEIPVYASAADAPYIRGERMLLKLAGMGGAGGFKPEIPPGIPEERVKAFLAALARPPRLRVTHELAGPGRLELAGGIRVIPTPGHTPGHICFFHEPTRTLVAGDALVAAEGALAMPPPQLCSEAEEALRSVRLLAACQAERVICYHGGLVEEGAREGLRALAAEVERRLGGN